MTQSLMTQYPNIKTLITKEEIATRIAALATEIAGRKPNKLLVIPILKGSFMFAADLIRAMHHAGLSPDVEFIQLSSYKKAMVSSGQVDIIKDIESTVENRDILVLDDILESGRTLAYAKDLLSARGAASVWTCVLLEKPNKRAVNIVPDFVGFECEDQFVVGYGMDVSHSLRELPFVGVIV